SRFPQELKLAVEYGLSRVELPWLRHHGKHHVETSPGCCIDERAGLRLEKTFALERQTQRPPSHRRVLVLAAGLVAEISERLVAADVHGPEDHRLVAGRFKHVAIEPCLAVALWKGGRNEKLELGAKKPDSVRTGQAQHRQIVAKTGVHHHFDPLAVPRERLD